MITKQTKKDSCNIGCYADSVTVRVLNGLGNSFTNTLGGGSIKSCISFCKNKGFAYAGVQFGFDVIHFIYKKLSA